MISPQRASALRRGRDGCRQMGNTTRDRSVQGQCDVYGAPASQHCQVCALNSSDTETCKVVCYSQCKNSPLTHQSEQGACNHRARWYQRSHCDRAPPFPSCWGFVPGGRLHQSPT